MLGTFVVDGVTYQLRNITWDFNDQDLVVKLTTQAMSQADVVRLSGGNDGRGTQYYISINEHDIPFRSAFLTNAGEPLQWDFSHLLLSTPIVQGPHNRVVIHNQQIQPLLEVEVTISLTLNLTESINPYIYIYYVYATVNIDLTGLSTNEQINASLSHPSNLRVEVSFNLSVDTTESIEVIIPLPSLAVSARFDLADTTESITCESVEVGFTTVTD